MTDEGYISPSKAATMLKVDPRTVRGWCQATLAGEPSPLKDVKQHINGYFWISKYEILELLSKYKIGR